MRFFTAPFDIVVVTIAAFGVGFAARLGYLLAEAAAPASIIIGASAALKIKEALQGQPNQPAPQPPQPQQASPAPAPPRKGSDRAA